jgi:hypothetical protein
MASGTIRNPAILYLGQDNYDYAWVNAFTLGGVAIVGRSVSIEYANDVKNDDLGSGIPLQASAGVFSTSLSMEIHALSWQQFKRSVKRFMSSSGQIFLSIAPPGQQTLTYGFTFQRILSVSQEYKTNEGLYVTVKPNIIGVPLENGEPVI